MAYKSIFKAEEGMEMEGVTPAPKSFSKTPMKAKGSMCTEDIANKFFTIYMAAQFYHWQTTSIAQHKMLGKVYDAVSDAKDTIMEYLLGVQAPTRLTTAPVAETPAPFSDQSVAKMLDDGFQFTIAMMAYADSRGLEELKNLASDLQGVFGKAKYLNTFS
jgi:hypothetical protein